MCKAMSDDTERINNMNNELYKSAKIFSNDFVKVLDERDKQKIFEVMTEHIFSQTQIIMNFNNKPGTEEHIDDKKLEKMKRGLFNLFGNLSK